MSSFAQLTKAVIQNRFCKLCTLTQRDFIAQLVGEVGAIQQYCLTLTHIGLNFSALVIPSILFKESLLPKCKTLETTLIIPFSTCGTNSQNMHYFGKSQRLSDIEFMLIYHIFKKISVCFKVFVECIVCFGGLKEASSFQLVPLTHETSPNTNKLKRACVESFRHFNTLSSRNPRSFGDTNFIA